jgi:hypothetical protein
MCPAIVGPLALSGLPEVLRVTSRSDGWDVRRGGQGGFVVVLRRDVTLSSLGAKQTEPATFIVGLGVG